MGTDAQKALNEEIATRERTHGSLQERISALEQRLIPGEPSCSGGEGGLLVASGCDVDAQGLREAISKETQALRDLIGRYVADEERASFHERVRCVQEGVRMLGSS